jgi:hypothetical protein
MLSMQQELYGHERDCRSVRAADANPPRMQASQDPARTMLLPALSHLCHNAPHIWLPNVHIAFPCPLRQRPAQVG